MFKIFTAQWNWIENNKDIYNAWLDKNVDKLKETESIEKLTIDEYPKYVFSRNELSFLHNSKWYINNLSIKESLEIANTELNKYLKIKKINKEISSLYEFETKKNTDSKKTLK